MPKRKRKTEEDGGSKSLNHLAAVAVATVATMPVKYKGVSKSGKKGKKFYAQIRVDGIMQRLGTYDTSKEAAEAYDLAAIHAGRPRSKLNFLNQVPKNYKVKGRKLLSTNTIGFRGVYKSRSRFRATIYVNGKDQNLGTFGTSKEAAIAHDLAAIQAQRQICDLNFPDMISTYCDVTSRSM